MGQSVTPGTEPSSEGQKELEGFGEDDVRHLPGVEPTVLDDNDERDVISAISSDALNNFDGGNRSVIGETATAGIWATYPQPFVSIITEVCDQVTIPMIPAHCNLNMPYNLNLLILRSYFNDS